MYTLTAKHIHPYCTYTLTHTGSQWNIEILLLMCVYAVAGVAGDPRVVEVGEVTDTRDPGQGDLFYYGSSFSESTMWPGAIPAVTLHPVTCNADD